MSIQDSIDEYISFCFEINEEELNALILTCRMLYLPQQVISTVLHVFFSAIKDIRIEPDDIVLHTACINLACKLSEFYRPLDKILSYSCIVHTIDASPAVRELAIESVNKTEVDICFALDFDFEVPAFYSKLEGLCKQNELSQEYRKRCWILLNDILRYPVSLFFTVPEIVMACMLVEYAAAVFPLSDCLEEGEEETNQTLLVQFTKYISVISPEDAVSDSALEYLALEILRICTGFV